VPCNYRFVEVNRVFEAQTGLADAAGSTALLLAPHLERGWIDTRGRVALTGDPVPLVVGSEAMRRWFSVDAARMGEPTPPSTPIRAA